MRAPDSRSDIVEHGTRLRRALAVGAATAAALLLPGAAFASTPPAGSSVFAPIGSHGLGLRRTAPAAPSARALALIRASASALPASASLTSYAMPVGDQGQVGSCAAWSSDYAALGYWENKQGIKGGALEPMFTYSQVDGGVDNGSTIEGNLQIDVQQGIDTQSDYPQGNFDYKDQPTAAEKANAVNWKLTSYSDLPVVTSSSSTVTQQSIETAIAAGDPVVIGIPVYENFFYIGTAEEGFYARPSGGLAGYHAIAALGYSSRGLVIENSWGTGWGNHGFATLSWSFVNSYVFDVVSVGPLVSGQPAATSAPAITGSAAVGQTLTASNGVWSPSATSYAYQWQHSTSSTGGWTAIGGAGSQSYSPVSSDAGDYIRVLVTATNANGSGVALSGGVGPVTGGGAPLNRSAPTVTGTPVRGSTLSAAAGTWSPAGTSYTYRWQRGTGGGSSWTNINGASASAYTPVLADENDQLRVLVTAVNPFGKTLAQSAAVGPVKASPPVNLTAPVVTGTAQVGSKLAAGPGSWSGTKPTFGYQWQRYAAGAWRNIASSTGGTYRASASDLGDQLRVLVTASDPDGKSTAVSVGTPAVAAA